MKYIFHFSIVLALYLMQLRTVASFQQELKLYEDYQGMTLLHSYHTGNKDPDLIGKNIVRMCFQGIWARYTQKNYALGSTVYWDMNEYEACYATGSGFPDFNRSFRPLAAEETDIDSISLYQDGVRGTETLIVQTAFGGLTHQSIGGITITGTAGWLAFEGQNFNGASRCLIPDPGKTMARWMTTSETGLKGIGSVIKGCRRSLTVEYLEEVRQNWAARVNSSSIHTTDVLQNEEQRINGGVIFNEE